METMTRAAAWLLGAGYIAMHAPTNITPMIVVALSIVLIVTTLQNRAGLALGLLVATPISISAGMEAVLALPVAPSPDAARAIIAVSVISYWLAAYLVHLAVAPLPQPSTRGGLRA